MQIVAHMGRQRTVAIVCVLHAISTRHLSTGRHGHVSLTGRRSRDGGSVVGDVIAFGVSRTSRGRSSVVRISGECLSGLPCGLLNSTGVVVLVTSQSGTASEGLLTCGVRALVRPLTRMNAAVPRQRTGITEGLQLSVLAAFLCPSCDGKQIFTFPQRSHMCGFSPV